MRGFWYNPETPNSSLSSFLTFSGNCTGDINLLEPLGVNLVVIADVDITVDHSYCISAFQRAGIYVLVYLQSDVQGVAYGIEGSASWNEDVFTYQTAVIDAVASYSNIFGFIVDSIANLDPDPSQTIGDTLPFIKAATRDIKSYIHSSNYRRIPVGILSDNSIGNLDGHWKMEYFRCGDLPIEDTIDFWFTIDDYACGDTTPPIEKHVQELISAHSSFGIPLLLYILCYDNYTLMDRLYDNEMSTWWSGGLIDNFNADVDVIGYGMAFIKSLLFILQG